MPVTDQDNNESRSGSAHRPTNPVLLASSASTPLQLIRSHTLEGACHGRFHYGCGAASTEAQGSTAASSQAGQSDQRPPETDWRLDKWNQSDGNEAEANDLRCCTQENRASTEGTVGEVAQGIKAHTCGEDDGPEAHHICCWKEKDRGCSKGEVGEG